MIRSNQFCLNKIIPYRGQVQAPGTANQFCLNQTILNSACSRLFHTGAPSKPSPIPASNKPMNIAPRPGRTPETGTEKEWILINPCLIMRRQLYEYTCGTKVHLGEEICNQEPLLLSSLPVLQWSPQPSPEFYL